MQNRKLILVVFLLYAFVDKAQNLVPNSSFEDYFYIINNISYPADNLDKVIRYWYVPTNGSSDYLTTLSKGNNSIPIQNTYDCNNYQSARNGSAFVGIGGGRTILKNESIDYISNEYIQTRLIKSLEYNKKYRCAFYVNVSACANMYVKDLVCILVLTQFVNFIILMIHCTTEISEILLTNTNHK